MKHSSAVLLIVLLLARASFNSEAIAQQTDSIAAPQETRQEEVRGVTLEQNYPNPFGRDTRIPFVLGADLFEDGRSVVVSVRVYNSLPTPRPSTTPQRRGDGPTSFAMIIRVVSRSTGTEPIETGSRSLRGFTSASSRRTARRTSAR